jgi:hypothetical protein
MPAPLGTRNGVSINTPGAVAVDASGDLFFTDDLGGLIYRIDASPAMPP